MVKVKGIEFFGDNVDSLLGYLRDVGDDIPNEEWAEIDQALTRADSGSDGVFDIMLDGRNWSYYVRKENDRVYRLMPSNNH